ncbi:MAG: hypothetical protein ABI203_03240 [Mucilaginibacter sp.]
MKKIVAILILGMFLLNLGGYNLVFKYFIQKSDKQLVNQMLDDKFNSSKLVEIKIPVHMPTVDDWTEYRDIVGQIQVNGTYYNYVKLKMTRDTMSMMCLPNEAKKHLVDANILVTKSINDIPLNKKGAEPISKKANEGYDHVYQVIECNYTQVAKLVRHFGRTFSSDLTNPYIESPGKPPNFSC